MSRTERDLAKIGIDLKAFLIDANSGGRTQDWCARQLHVSRKTISEHVRDYGIKWGYNAMKKRHGFVWRGVFDSVRGHCARIGVDSKTANSRRKRTGEDYRDILDHYAA